MNKRLVAREPLTVAMLCASDSPFSTFRLFEKPPSNAHVVPCRFLWDCLWTVCGSLAMMAIWFVAAGLVVVMVVVIVVVIVTALIAAIGIVTLIAV